MFVCCLVAADFLSGVFHWLEDTYCSDGLPVPFIGSICDDNIQHHITPGRMRFGSFLTRNGATMFLSAAAAFGVWLAGIATTPVILTLVLLSFANEVHSWNHGRGGRFVRLAREMGLFQSAKQHNRHHRPPFDCHYCVMTSWVNPILERIDLWRNVERFLRLFGIHPARESRSDARNSN